MLLVWDGLDLHMGDRYSDDDSPAAEVWRELVAEGLITVKSPTTGEIEEQTADEVVAEWTELPWEEIVGENSHADFAAKLAEGAVEAAVNELMEMVKDLLSLAAERGTPPVALDPLAAKAAALPAVDKEAPATEGILIQAAAQGVRVGTGCSVEDILAFRHKNRPLMGRFRAALIDLAAAMQADSPVAAAEEARAVVANRIEPSLADLEASLSENRIRFFWNALIGASAVALGDPIGPAAAVTGAGSIVTRNLRYAFNRQRLVQDHPFGLLHEIGVQVGAPEEDQGSVLTDPVGEAQAALTRRVETLIRSAFELHTLKGGSPPSSGEEPGPASS
ncbi:MAG TPA: hypothetical protein VEP91_11830 [Solirubrobacterales bacterium]|nr:hypothetical protein [Solirubrobacterales bacterium]